MVKECDYCNVENYRDRWVGEPYEDNIYTGLDSGDMGDEYAELQIMYDKKTKQFYIIAQGGDCNSYEESPAIAELPINYCPICGRKLNK